MEYCYLRYDEAPKAEVALARMSEMGKCLITGSTTDLVCLPVDLNPNNILPCNMACISKDLIDQLDFCYQYELSHYDLTVTFSTSSIFEQYNETLFQAHCELPNSIFEKHFNHKFFVELYENLITFHFKGIKKVRYQNKTMEWFQFQQYLAKNLENLKQRSKIITPNFGGIIQ